jgi:hypothetical protein
MGLKKLIRNGKHWLAVPIVLIKPGVWPVYPFPLLYTESELRASDWSGVPLIAAHPPKRGIASAIPAKWVWREQGLGYVQNVAYRNDALGGMALFSEARIERVEPRLLDLLHLGASVEVSIGHRFRRVPAPAWADCDWMATLIRPDHVSILLDGKPGACPCAAGAGINPPRRPCAPRREALQWPMC